MKKYKVTLANEERQELSSIIRYQNISSTVIINVLIAVSVLRFAGLRFINRQVVPHFQGQVSISVLGHRAMPVLISVLMGH